MIQEDRHTHNIIFKIDKETNYFDFAPFYDFSNCSDILKDNIDNAIILLNKETLNILIKSYPIFKDILEEVFKSSFNALINKVLYFLTSSSLTILSFSIAFILLLIFSYVLEAPSNAS